MGWRLMEEMEIHPQAYASLMSENVLVDAEMVLLLEALGQLGIKTYESCQNYGEYLRFMELDHVFEAKRDYAYVEFYSLIDAHTFIRIARDSGVQNPIHHRIVHEGTPDAWELKLRMTAEGHAWVWFPNYDIEGVTKLIEEEIDAQVQAAP